MDHHGPVLPLVGVDRMPCYEGVLEDSLIRAVNWLEIVLLVLQRDQVLELEPLFDLVIRLAVISISGVALNEQGQQVSRFCRAVVAVNLVRILNTLHGVEERAEAFCAFMQREKVLIVVPLCALPMLELVELGAHAIPPFDPELDRPEGLVLDRSPVCVGGEIGDSGADHKLIVF